MLNLENKLKLSKENVSQFEQVAIIKFLAKEKTPSYEIFCRLKRIYKNKVLSLERVSAMVARFTAVNCNVDGTILEEGKELVKLMVNEDGEVFNVDNSFEDMVFNNIVQFGEVDNLNVKQSRKRFQNEKKFNEKKLKSKKAYLQTEFKLEAPDIEVEYLDIDENEADEDTVSLDEAIYEVGIFDDDLYIEGIKLDEISLPFLPIMSPEIATNVLVKLHKDFKCKLCNPKDLQYQSSLRRHLLLAHARRTVPLDDQMSVRCRRSCVKDSVGHFHCSKCLKAFMTRRRLFVHFQRHFFKGGKPTSLLETNVIHTRCICVDRDSGVFMVEKSDFGTMGPIHVQKNESFSICSEVLCQKAMSIAIEQNIADFECKHLKQISPNCSLLTEIIDLQANSLHEIPECRKQECLALLNFAKCKKVSPVVQWSINGFLIYFSVISKSSSSWFNRSLLEYLPAKREFKCSTCIAMPCAHCDLANLFINSHKGKKLI